MSALYLLLLLPALPIVIWAIYVKLKEQKYFETILISIPAIAVIADAVIVYSSVTGIIGAWLQWLQMLLCATIVPLAYLYFSRLIGRQFNNGTNIVLWLLLFFLLVPNCVIFWPGEDNVIASNQVRRFAIQIVRDGKVSAYMYTGDFIIMLQALLTMLRMVPTVRTLHRFGLMFDRKVYAFGIWWAMAIAFIATVSLCDIQVLATTLGSVYFFGGLSMLLATIYLLIALHFDLQPVKTEEGETVSSIDSYIEQQSSLITQMKHIVEVDRVYLQPGYRTEDILKALTTNRTYFTRMMQETFGKTFSQYLNEHRLAHAQHLLLTTDLTQNEIALQSGFNDATYMSRLFKNIYNLTPRQWQKENSQK